MSLKVIIQRRVPASCEAALPPLLRQLRSLALQQPGYLSGETLVHLDEPEAQLVISSWRDRACWEQWVNHPQRAAVQTQIDALLNSETRYDLYQHS